MNDDDSEGQEFVEDRLSVINFEHVELLQNLPYFGADSSHGEEPPLALERLRAEIESQERRPLRRVDLMEPGLASSMDTQEEVSTPMSIPNESYKMPIHLEEPEVD